MKSYPSIFKLPCDFDAHIFDKIDGSNLRFEWSRKNGWYKFGTRNRLFDESDEQFGEAIPLFYDTLAEPVAKIAWDKQWKKVVIFAEFWGKHSVAGFHSDKDKKNLTLFDVSPHQKGILPPKQFRKLFEGKVDTAKYLGQVKWNKGFLARVRANDFPGVTFEGVVGKGIHKNKLVMAKAKTQIWIDKVIEVHADHAAEILNS